MLQFATLSSNFFKTQVSALWHISSIVHWTLWDYLPLWENKKLSLRLTGSKDLLTVHNFTTFIHLLTNRAKGLLLKTFPAAGAWQHTEAHCGLWAWSTPQLLQAIKHSCQHPSHHQAGNWPVMLFLCHAGPSATPRCSLCHAALCATLLLVPLCSLCHISPSATLPLVLHCS